MKTKLTGARAALADVIESRNSAAKALAVAEANYDDHNRDAFEPAMEADYKALKAMSLIEEEIKDVGRRYPKSTGYVGFGASGAPQPEPDEKAVLQHFLRVQGQTPDELRAAARKARDVTLEDVSSQATLLTRLEAIRDNARTDLEEIKSKIEGAVRGVMREKLDALIGEAKSAAEQSLKASAALLFVAGGTDRLWSGVLSNQNVYWQNPGDPKAALQAEGAAPWRMAYQQLFVDANAPLPIGDDDVTEAEAA